eukprot:m.96940 g.96940  ORF g.96940 m.96940 type:complete len:74 (-) comp10191_c0_seq3:62-283(-)
MVVIVLERLDTPLVFPVAVRLASVGRRRRVKVDAMALFRHIPWPGENVDWPTSINDERSEHPIRSFRLRESEH